MGRSSPISCPSPVEASPPVELRRSLRSQGRRLDWNPKMGESNVIVDQRPAPTGVSTPVAESGLVNSSSDCPEERLVVRERRGDRNRGPPLVLTYSDLGGVPANIPLVDNTAEVDVVKLRSAERPVSYPPTGIARKYPPRPRLAPPPHPIFLSSNPYK